MWTKRTSRRSAIPSPTGEQDNPFNTITDALAFIDTQRALNAVTTNPEPDYVLRLLGNAGDDGEIETLTDNIPYEIGFEPPFNAPLPDGASLDVPKNVTVMIDSTAIFKNRLSSINVGSENPSVDRSGSALQVLGTPFLVDDAGDPLLDENGERIDGSVYFTSWSNEAIGADTNPNAPQTPQGGDWGGLLFRNDADKQEARFTYDSVGVFLNHVNHADISFGGGKVVIGSVQQTIAPVHLIQARPTITYNTITESGIGAISADPNSFEETNFHSPRFQFSMHYTSDYDRVGPDIHDNLVIENSSNALVMRIATETGGDVVPLSVAARIDEIDLPILVQENLVIQGTPGGPFLEQSAPPSTLVTFPDANPTFTGDLNPGDNFRYIFTYIDSEGNESPPSDPAPSPSSNPPLATVNANGVVQISNLPTTPANSRFVGRRIYRSEVGGALDSEFTLVAQINGSDITYIDNGVRDLGGLLDRSLSEVTGVRRARLDASLVIDPGVVVKLEGSRIETGIGATFIAEGRDGREVIFTSRLDDRFGGSGTFDTNDDDSLGVNEAEPDGGDWSGLVFGPASTASIDHALITNAGGISKVAGSFAAFNAVSFLQTAEGRLTNSEVRNAEIGQGGQDGQPDSDRAGFGFNAPAAIFIRGSQPVIANNIIADSFDRDNVDFNSGSTVEVAAINVDVNSLNFRTVGDHGRATGLVDRFDLYRDNQGPLIAENEVSGNSLNGMEVRGGFVTTEVVWDDTSITHILRDEIIVPDFATYGGIRLESSSTASLVVKLENRDPNGLDPLVPDVAGFTATGNPLDIDDRIGGMLHVIGQPGHPVILTSTHDDTVAAGFQPNGDPVSDLRGDGETMAPAPGDWRSLRIDAYANDRNVDVGVELFEGPDVASPGINATPSTAQFLGELAPNVKSGDETRRLGYVINGYLNDPQDVDVYSFNAQPGTEVWFDIDRTTHALDVVVELVDALGRVIARSDNSHLEGIGDERIFEVNPPSADVVDANVLQKSLSGAKDHWTTNPRDAGFRIVLPGTSQPGATPTYSVRVRSSHPDIDTDPNILAGASFGAYQLQVRLTEVDEQPGSTVRFADIRYATNGVEIIGQPTHSFLTGEAVEVFNGGATDDTNNSLFNAQSVGNVLDMDRSTLAIAGVLGVPDRPGFAGHPGFDDVDFYRFDLEFENLQSIVDSNNPANDPLNNPNRHVPITLDIDYADGFSRANTVLSVFDSQARLILIANDGSIEDDQPEPLSGSDLSNLDAGSNGILDPFIGTIELPACNPDPSGGCVGGTGTYYVAVSSVATLPQVMRQFQNANNGFNAINLTRLEPNPGVTRIVDDRIETFLPSEVIVEHDDDNGVEVEQYLPPTTSLSETINNDTLRGGTNIDAEITGGFLQPVPFTLSDLDLYVVSSTQPNAEQATLRVVDPFTGHHTNTVGVFGEEVGDLAIRTQANLASMHAFNFNNPAGARTDANVGQFLTIDWGTAQVTGSDPNSLQTFHNPGDGTAERDDQPDADGWGYQYEAMAFTTNGADLYAVGSKNDPGRIDSDRTPTPDNVLFRHDPATGDAINPGCPSRTGNARWLGAGTDIVERGELATFTRIIDLFGTGGTISIPSIPGQSVSGNSLAQLVANWNAFAAANPGPGIASFEASLGFSFQFGQQLELRFVDRGDGGDMALALGGGLLNGLTFGTTVTQTTGFGPGGRVSGLSFIGGNMYAVSDEGGAWQVNNYTGCLTASTEFVGNVIDEFGDRVDFQALTTGPSTEANDFGVGTHSNLLFGMDTDGNLYAFYPEARDFGIPVPGQLEPVFFDHQTSVATGLTRVRGIEFSNLQANLWGATTDRGGDDGHGINESIDGSRDPSAGLLSLHFGTGDRIGTNNARVGYNFPGGAHGVVESQTFDLSSYSAADQPFLYFNYFLDTEQSSYAGPYGGPSTYFNDSFRVFAADDSGEWRLLATNNEFRGPTNEFQYDEGISDHDEGVQELFDNTGWRQARISLSDFVGKPNVRVRMEFNTAGDSNIGDPLTTGEELRTIDATELRDAQSFQLTNINMAEFVRPGFAAPQDYVTINPVDRFETDFGFTLVAPSGSKLQNGMTFEVDGVVYEFNDDDLDGVRGNNFGGPIAATSDVLVPFHKDMTAEEVAFYMQAAVETNYVPLNFAAGNINDDGRGHGFDPATSGPYLTPPSNDTLGRAVDTQLVFGEGVFTASANIGDNPNLIPANAAEAAAFPQMRPFLDVDIYRVQVTERSRILVSADTAIAGGIGNVELTLFDAEGNLLDTTNSDLGDLDFGRGPQPVSRNLPQHSDAPEPRFGDADPGYVIPSGIYYVAVSAGGNTPQFVNDLALIGFDPMIEGSGFIPGLAFDTGNYDLSITIENFDAPVLDTVSPITPPAVDSFLRAGDDRLSIDYDYTYINTIRDGNRINVPSARDVSSPMSDAAAPNTPFARFVEGTPGVFAGDADNAPNIPIRLHAGMDAQEVARTVAQTMADVYAGGKLRNVKHIDETVKLIGHQLTSNDLGPLGNNPGALGLKPFGYSSLLDNHLMPGDSTFDPISGQGSNNPFPGTGTGFGYYEASTTEGGQTNRAFPGALRAQRNLFEGVFIDDIIIGFAERGEMVTGAPSNSTFSPNLFTPPNEILDGAYQLEIRTSADYSLSIFDTFNSLDTLLYRSFDTNTRHSDSVSVVAPSGWEIDDEQTFTLSDGVNTLTFEFDDLDLTDLGVGGAGVASGNVAVGFRDFEPADVIAERIRDAINSNEVQAVLEIQAALSDGTVNGLASASNVVNLFGNVIGNVPENNSAPETYNDSDFGAIDTIHFVEKGDQNQKREQGQILVHSNFITRSEENGVLVTPGDRESTFPFPNSTIDNNPVPGPVRNLVELNPLRLSMGPVISNNVISRSGQAGIRFEGDQTAITTQQGAVSYGRAANNTIYGTPTGAGIGIEVRDSAPTLLNNVVSNLSVGVIVDPINPSPAVPDPAVVVMSGTLFANNGTPANTPATLGLGDFAINLDDPSEPNKDLFVAGNEDNFYLLAGSRAIDSSVDSLSDRPQFVTVRDPLGIEASPILTSDRDATGQLRVDDPTISTPAGQGQNTFKDRGALDRSDLIGPTAIIINPFDNDAEQLDVDPTGTIVFRPTGVFNRFEIQLLDGLAVGSQVDGIGVDDSTVIQPTVTVTQDGQFLREGIDYTFDYNNTSDTIRLTPLAGIWEEDAVYVITLNNRDRYVLTAPAGNTVDDQDQFRLKDANGDQVVFEFESGYTMQVPQTLLLQAPAAGGGPGGIADGKTFSISNAGFTVNFEFDSNGVLLDSTNTRLAFTTSDDVNAIADKIVEAIASAGLGLSPSNLGNGMIHVGGTQNHVLDIPDATNNVQRLGAENAVVDGDTFSITREGRPPVVFEFDLDRPANVGPGNIAVPIRLADDQSAIARAVANAIAGSGLELTPTALDDGRVHIGGIDHTVDVTGSNLTLAGQPGVTTNLQILVPAEGGDIGGVADGQQFEITDGTQTVTFEFDDDGQTSAGNSIISINTGPNPDTQDQLAARIVTALIGSGLPVEPEYLGDGVVSVGGTIQVSVDVQSAPALMLQGVPGGAVPVRFVPFATFTPDQMNLVIIDAINNSPLNDVRATLRGGGSLFLEGVPGPNDNNVANPIEGQNIAVQFLEGVKDLAQNGLQPNQTSEETRFFVALGDIDVDFGDSPDASISAQFRYTTQIDGNGARHVIYNENPLFLGRRVDADLDGAPSLNSDGDDIEGNGLAFDLSATPALTVSGGATPLTISAPETFFVELPELGGFDLADGETFTVGDGVNSVTFEFDSDNSLTNPSNTRIPFSEGLNDRDLAARTTEAINAAGLGFSAVATGARVHLGSRDFHTLDTTAAPSLISGGVAGSVRDGDTFEVTTSQGVVTFEFDEDSTFALNNRIIEFSPSMTHIELADVIITQLLAAKLGVTPLALGDGVIELDGDDEDGVTFGGPFNAFLDTPITVVASAAGLLDAFIDFNRDGDWNDPGEKIFNSVLVQPGENLLIANTPINASPGETRARFRLSNLGGLGVSTLSASGEIEDYAVTIRGGVPPVANDDPETPGDPTYATDEDTALPVGRNVLANDEDSDNDPLSVSDPGPRTSLNGASVVVNVDGSFSYDPTGSTALQSAPSGGEILDVFSYRAFGRLPVLE